MLGYLNTLVSDSTEILWSRITWAVLLNWYLLKTAANKFRKLSLGIMHEPVKNPFFDSFNMFQDKCRPEIMLFLGT